MAQLTEAQKDEVAATIQELLSSSWLDIGVSKTQLRAGIDVFDQNLETCESNIFSGVGPAAQTWLQSNTTIARFILERVARKRRENL